MATGNPTGLIPLVQQAYGTPVKLSFDSIERGIQKREENVKDKQEKLKSLYEIGADLDAKGHEKFMDEMNSLVWKLERGTITYGDAEFAREQAKLVSGAKALKEASDLVKDMQKNIQRDPDKYEYLQNAQTPAGSEIRLNAGLDGLAKDLQAINERNYKDIPELVSALSGLGNNLRVNPYSSYEYEEQMRKGAEQLSKDLFSDAEAQATSREVGHGQVMITTTKTANEDRYDRAVSGFAERFAPYTRRMYDRMVMSGEIDENEVSFADFAYADAERRIPREQRREDIRSIPQSNKAPEKEPEKMNPELIDEINKDIQRAQQEDDPSYILKYVEPFGYKVQKSATHFRFHKTVYLADGSKDDKEVVLAIDNTHGIQKFLSQIDSSIKFKELSEAENQPTSQRTTEQRKQEAEAETKRVKDGRNEMAERIARVNSLGEAERAEVIKFVKDLGDIEYSTGWRSDTIKYKDEDGKIVKIDTKPENIHEIVKLLEKKKWTPPKPQQQTQQAQQTQQEAAPQRRALPRAN